MKKIFLLVLAIFTLLVSLTSVYAARYRITCPNCYGAGTITYEEIRDNPDSWMEGEDQYITEEVETTCPDCDGRGYIYVNR